ncbi:MAG: ATP-binding cassette domain-containing protein, partial [Planctomycetales bacterium]|nr:ATP-binding cassette domain-containing protein [Planctomycetales bacterium]
LTLSRGAATLSNGEAQRIRLASQLGSGLCGVLYVLDEPTIGLHPRDNTRLLTALHKLRDLGNTLVVVEHDREVIEGCDAICDFGPAAGRLGGQVVAQGSPTQLSRRRGSVTGPYLSGKKAIGIPSNRRLGKVSENANDNVRGKATGNAKAAPTPLDQVHSLRIINARHRNLRGIDVTIPLETLTAITGPSGSGKSSLVNDVLYATLARTLHRASVTPGAHDEIRGLEHINKVIRVDQTPLGNSPTSNPATYTGVFDKIRELFAQLPDAKVRGYSPRRFSFNVAGGRCEDCEGNGQKCIEMHFLPDVWVECETCRGKRYNPETLAIQFHGQSISDVLEMTCGDAVQLFENIPSIRRILQTLCDVGLDYLTLGQSAPTLSGGEAQRVKLAAELARPNTGRTLYLLDEPTTGLHFDDLAKLLEVMQRLVDLGNTVVVIEHNLDVIKQADWVIDMGPEAGEAGGQVVIAGTPEQVVEYATTQSRGSDRRSYTGEALAPILAAGPYVLRPTYSAEEHAEAAEEKFRIADVIGDAAMPWEKDGHGWHTRDRVGRNGEPCRWDGRILADVIDRIYELGTFSETNWNSRSVVEIAAETKSYGWFLHAITGETWLLKLKFRVPSNTFQATKLRADLPLKTLNEMYDIPLYSNDPRIKIKSTRGPLQEIELRLHGYEEIDRPAFWHFLETAVEAFQRFASDAPKTLDEHMPWKKLGKKWHLMRKGFPNGKRIAWEVEVL